MSARNGLTALTAVLASGKTGYIEGIKQASAHYKADASIMPSEFAELNRKQTVVHYGGYLSAHKVGLSAEYIYGFADAIAEYADKIDLSADTEALRVQLTSLSDEYDAKVKAEADKSLALGDTGESLSRSILRRVKELAIAMEVTTTPKMVDAIQVAIKELEDLLPQSVVVANQIKADAFEEALEKVSQ